MGERESGQEDRSEALKVDRVSVMICLTTDSNPGEIYAKKRPDISDQQRLIFRFSEKVSASKLSLIKTSTRKTFSLE